MILTLIIAGFALCGLIAYLLVRGGSDGPEPSDYESDWTGSADSVGRWGDHASQENRK